MASRELAGVAVFSVPVNERTIPRYTTLEPRAGVELGRFVLLPDTGFNAETWFLARAFDALRAEKPDVRVIVSYADPVERRNGAGAIIKPQHWGTIYQAHNARYGGRSSAETLLIAPDGQIVNRRALSKIRLGERGWEGAAERLSAARIRGSVAFVIPAI